MKQTIFKFSIGFRLLLLLLAAALLPFSAGCGESPKEPGQASGAGDSFPSPPTVDSAIFNGSWIPLSENAAQNAIQIEDGEVTWYVLSPDGSGFYTMEEYRKQLLAGNEYLKSAEFSASLVEDRLTMRMVVTGIDGQVQQDIVTGSLSISGDTLTLSLTGGLIGGSANQAIFTRGSIPAAK